MKSWQDAMLNRRLKHWSLSEMLFFCVSEVVRKEWYNYSAYKATKRLKRFLVEKDEECYFDFNGAKLPDIRVDKKNYKKLWFIFEDVFLIACYHADSYEKTFVELVDQWTGEGPYCYKDGKFDVTLHAGDTVIDAGAWIGDFSAYAASKGAFTYAFEPTSETFAWLERTADLNDRRIEPIPMGLGNHIEMKRISINPTNSGNNSFLRDGDESAEPVGITTLDRFVEERGLKRVDFIKSDIEGYERNLLLGARETLKKFAPKLAICTYHLPDDPVVLAQIIKEANPDYTIVQLRSKLFAAVI